MNLRNILKYIPIISQDSWFKHIVLWIKFNSSKVVLMLLTFGIGSFLLSQVHSLDGFIYSPGSDFSDLTVTFWPNIFYIQNSIKEFNQIPLWRTLIFSGAPFDADPQSGLWYLPNIVFLLLPAAQGLNILFLGHIVFGGFGMWMWAREVGISRSGSFLAALSYAYTPKVIAHLGAGHVGLVFAAAYIPWVFRSAFRIGRGKWRCIGVFAILLGFQIIANPQVAFYTGIVACIYAGMTTLWLYKKDRDFDQLRVSAVGIFLGFFLALAISAVQTYPMLRFAPLSGRSGMGLIDTAFSSLPLQYLWGLVVADHNGYNDFMLYIGIPVLGLSVLSFKRFQAKFWWAFIILSLVYTLGPITPLYPLLYKLLPVLSWLRVPTRIVFLNTAAFALLGGMGFDNLVDGINQHNRKIYNIILLGVAAFAAVLVIGYGFVIGKPPLNLFIFGLMVPATVVILGMHLSGKLKKQTTFLLLTFLLLGDLILMDATLIEGRSFEEVFRDNGLSAYINKHKGVTPFRIYSPSYSLPRHIGALYNIETADGVDPLYLSDYDEYMQFASGVQRSSYGVTLPAMEGAETVYQANKGALPSPKLFGLLNVKYIASEFPINHEDLLEVSWFGSTYLYENKMFLPRAFMVGSVELVNDFKDSLDWLKDHDLSREAVVMNGSSLNSGEVAYSIEWLDISPNSIFLKVNANRPGFLVLSQVYYPGWKLIVDGNEETLVRVDGILSGFPLNKGNHNIELIYQPISLIYGLSITTIGILVSVVLVFWERGDLEG